MQGHALSCFCFFLQINFFKLLFSNMQKHRKSFVTREDFRFLSERGINAVRIPVGWWIAQDPSPPAPFIGGTLAALDRAFSWAQ